ncbi:MAG TPA: hypothetical protein VE262_25955 [Blastocatellia bacterium]|jgi:hypothetical protein|nr:hypothetical protein [Blastocatellia bacterium]
MSMIYVQHQKTGRTVEVPGDAEIPEGWTVVDSVLCSWCGEKEVNEEFSDWYLTLVCNHRYCSEECKKEHSRSKYPH